MRLVLATWLSFVFLSASAQTQLQLLDQARQASNKKQWPAAEALWLRVTQTNPTLAEAWLEEGRARNQQGRFLEAVQPLKEADRLGVSMKWDMPYFIACCYARAGDRQLAMSWLSTAVANGFRPLEQAQQDDDLKTLRDDPHFKELAGLPDLSKMTRDEGWRYDVRLCARELVRLRYDPFRSITQKEFAKQARELEKEVAKLTDNEIGVRLMKLAVLIHDGHTHMHPPCIADHSLRVNLPVAFSAFEEGVFITSSDSAHADLLGAQVVKVGDHETKDALERIRPCVNRDNDMSLKENAPRYLRYPKVLNGLGLIPDDSRVVLTLEFKDGQTKEVLLPASAAFPDKDWVALRERLGVPLPLTLKRASETYWYEYLPESKTVFVQYNACREDPKESIEAFCKRLFTFVADNPVERLVLDMRWNGGGNNFLNKPLIVGLAACKVNKRGSLFVITSGRTFSAAICGVGQITKYTNAILVGQPTGSSPNFIGENTDVRLPYSHCRGTVSDLYWQNTDALDNNIWLAPEIYVPFLFSDYVKGKDLAMESILAENVHSDGSDLKVDHLFQIGLLPAQW